MTASVAPYGGAIIDAFVHGPWIGAQIEGKSRADRVEWNDDRRLHRVMQTFKHVEDDAAHTRHLSEGQVLDAMAGAGVEGAVLAVKVYYAARADAVEALNRQFAEICATAPAQLKWIASMVPPELGASSYWDVMQNTRMLDALRELDGLCGVHITPSPWGLAPDDRWFYPVYTKCVELGLPLYTYVGMPGPLWPMAHNDPVHLDEVALAFPDLTIIAHHIGDPWTDTAVRLAARHENFFICTSAWSPRAYPEALMRFLNGKWHGVWGCDKVLFASDFPLMDLHRTIRDARRMKLGEEPLQKFLYANARALFWDAD